MSYVKTSWVARVGTALNRFLKTNETSTEVELTNDPAGVSVQGTPFTVANMNKIEQGIYDAHVALDNNGLIGNTRVNQDVRTTASPTFADVHATVNGAQFYTGGAKKAIVFSGTKTEDEWYELLLPYFPSVGDKVCANGWASDGVNKGRIMYAYRDPDRIYIPCSNSTADGTIAVGVRSGIFGNFYAVIVL